MSAETADSYGERAYGEATLAGFDPKRPDHRAAAAALHDRLVAIGFGPDRAAALFGVADLVDVRPPRARYYDAFVLPDDAAGRAARFFCLHAVQDEAGLAGWLGADLIRFLGEMRAIVRVQEGWRSLVGATWFAGRLLLTDARAIDVVWPNGEVFPDLVMPPGGDSIGLVRVAPRQARRRVLDLCCGAGAQTLAAAAYGEHVTGVDLNPRALRFARFNAAANRIPNARFLLGDAYEPLGRERFDAILSNPPFVPWPETGAPLLFRGGGPRGEDVLQRIFAGAVNRLEPGGSLAVVADLADAETLPVRIAAWQGEARRTLMLLQRRYELVAYAESHAGHLEDAAERGAEVVRLLRHFRSAGIGTLDFGYIVQDAEPGPTHVVRTVAARHGSIAASVADWFAAQRRIAELDLDAAPLVLAPGVRLMRVSARAAGGAAAESFHLVTAPPSLAEGRDLSAGLFEILDRTAASGVRLCDVEETRTARDLRDLVDRGLLRPAGEGALKKT